MQRTKLETFHFLGRGWGGLTEGSIIENIPARSVPLNLYIEHYKLGNWYILVHFQAHFLVQKD